MEKGQLDGLPYAAQGAARRRQSFIRTDPRTIDFVNNRDQT